MKVLCIFVLLSLAVVAVPAWDPVGINTRTAIGAYNRVSRAYQGRLVLEKLLQAFHKVTVRISSHGIYIFLNNLELINDSGK